MIIQKCDKCGMSNEFVIGASIERHRIILCEYDLCVSCLVGFQKYSARFFE
jgi:hypothetical protein